MAKLNRRVTKSKFWAVKDFGATPSLVVEDMINIWISLEILEVLELLLEFCKF